VVAAPWTVDAAAHAGRAFATPRASPRFLNLGCQSVSLAFQGVEQATDVADRLLFELILQGRTGTAMNMFSSPKLATTMNASKIGKAQGKLAARTRCPGY
jgi:hypothetical protein